MLKFAITGNIAAGKSEVEKILKNYGLYVVDTDEIAHEILDNCEEIKSAFDKFDIITNGKVDRKKLADIVFSDSDLLKKLENIVHPLVREKLREIFNRDSDLVFVSVPQLFEAGFETMFDKIVYIYAGKDVRLKRLMQRNNLSENDALTRINAQIPDNEKIKKSDFVIENNSGYLELKENVESFLRNQQIV